MPHFEKMIDILIRLKRRIYQHITFPQRLMGSLNTQHFNVFEYSKIYFQVININTCVLHFFFIYKTRGTQILFITQYQEHKTHSTSEEIRTSRCVARVSSRGGMTDFSYRLNKLLQTPTLKIYPVHFFVFSDFKGWRRQATSA